MKLTAVGLDHGIDDNFARSRFLFYWDLKSLPKKVGPFILDGSLELAAGQVQPSPQNVNIGLTPVLEWQLSNSWVIAPYLETGLGINYLTRNEQLGRQFSTHFQFGETLGFGVRYKNTQVSARYQHLSNADIVKPNNGYNFYGVSIRYNY